MIAYGLEFPDSTHPAFIEMLCAFRLSGPRLLPRHEHLLNACRLLFTPEQFGISPWTVEHAKDFTETKFCIVLGSASCEKSNDFGLFSLLFWLTAPHETGVTVVTTTKDMARYRSYEAIQRYYAILKGHPDISVPGREDKTSFAIVLEEGEMPEGMATTRKGSIRCLPIADGSETDAITRLAGAHSKYFIYLLDELDGLREVAMRARVNMMIGPEDFRLFGLTNPVGRHNWTAKYVQPKGGWDSVDVDTGVWESAFGRVRHHDGLKSPAIKHPEKYPHLINQAQIDRVRDVEGEDSPDWWRMVRGFPAPQVTEATVLTPTLIRAHKMDTKAVWRGGHPFFDVAGLDPAFTSGGDACVLQFARIGPDESGYPRMEYTDTLRLAILASSDRPVAYQVVDQVRTALAERLVSPRNLCVDDSGTQSIADVCDVELGTQVLRVNFSLRPGEDVLSTHSPDTADERYRNMVTWIWMLVAGLGREGHIRGLPVEAAEQFCLRRFKRSASHLLHLESKVEFKKRLPGRKSPDTADACALAAFAAYRNAGLVPGTTDLGSARSAPERYGYPASTGPAIGLPLRTNYLDGGVPDRLRSYAGSGYVPGLNTRRGLGL